MHQRVGNGVHQPHPITLVANQASPLQLTQLAADVRLAETGGSRAGSLSRRKNWLSSSKSWGLGRVPAAGAAMALLYVALDIMQLKRHPWSRLR